MSLTVTLQRELTLQVISCGSCGVEYGLLDTFVSERRRDHATWYCPNGHPRYYPGKTEAQLLLEEQSRTQQVAEQRDQALRQARELQRSLDGALESINAEKKKRAALEHRVENGVCPHCQRTFKQLSRHVRSKHKGSEEAAAVAEEMRAR
jgi:hypothetical protein